MAENKRLTIDEALDILLKEAEDIPGTGSEEVWLLESIGRVLAEDVVAECDVPSFNRSAMDGYAVRAIETKDASPDSPAELDVIAELMAGDWSELIHSPLTAVRVMTGAMVPEGYDAVVKQEDTDLGEKKVRIFRQAEAGLNYSPVGEDIKKGTELLEAGSFIDQAAIGIMASQGIARVKVRQSVKTAFISTGSEVMMPGHELGRGKIYNNSAYMMAATVKSLGLENAGLKAVGDDEELLVKEIRETAKRAGIIITTGGISVGKMDLMPQVLQKLGAKILFRNVDIQPGTPTIGARYENCILLCLSGNPFAALANFQVYYFSVVAKLMGCSDLEPVICEGIMDEPYEKKNVHTRLLRARLMNGRVTFPEKVHAASVLSNLKHCNCLIELEPGRTLEKGDRVKLRLI